MKTEKVQDYPGLKKVNGCYVVNEDRDAYRSAVLRRKTAKENLELKNRVRNLEDMMSKILNQLELKNETRD